MAWMITFEDEPTKVGLRATHGDRHVAYVRSIAPRVLCAGGLREAADGPQVGGMWILDVATREEALGLFQADPFFAGGLRANVQVRHWTKGVWEGKLQG